MPNYEQAPILINKKPPGQGAGFLQIDNAVYAAVCKGVGRKYKAGLLMLWYIGQADGFRIPAKTVMDVFGFKRKDDYYSTRRDLVDLGFIDVVDTDTIRINYDNILKGQENADPILLEGSGKSRPYFLKGQENPDPMKGQENPDPIFSEQNRVRKIQTLFFEGSGKTGLKGQENPDPMGQENPDHNIQEHTNNIQGDFDLSSYVNEDGKFVF